MITIRNSQHLARVLRHLRETQHLTRRDLANRLFISHKTLCDRERATRSWDTDGTIDAAHTLGYDIALVPSRRPGRRPTGTGWPA